MSNLQARKKSRKVVFARCLTEDDFVEAVRKKETEKQAQEPEKFERESKKKETERLKEERQRKRKVKKDAN